MKLFLSLFLSIPFISIAQSADFITLKKKGKTVETFYSGSNISFTSTNGSFITARINQVKNDTLYLQEFIIRHLPTTFGTYIIDTPGSYHYKYHYNQVKAIGPQKNTNFNWQGSGSSLLGGGALLTLGSGVVFLVDRKKFSAPLLIAAASLGTLGYFMNKGENSGIKLGKKYKLVYMNMSAK